jgi:sugar/nucleoside kinase (ribokinase family)
MNNTIIGLGNALVDILINIEDDSILDTLQLPKGSMQLVDESKRTDVLNETQNLSRKIVSGGSAANTIHGLAKLGVSTSFVGKIGEDEYGKLYTDDMKNAGIKTALSTSKSATGTATTLISKDAERTFATFLGAAVELSPEDIFPSIFDGHAFLYIEGYLVQNHALIEKAVKVAKECGLKVILDLASFNVVEANLDFLKMLVKNYIDLLFANEEEAKSFTGLEPEQASEEIAKEVEIAVVKVGSKGSLIQSEGKTYTVKIDEIESIDSTGAGDAYAAGFIFGLTKNFPLDTCGRLGSLLAAQVIQQLGARITDEKWNVIQTEIKQYL